MCKVIVLRIYIFWLLFTQTESYIPILEENYNNHLDLAAFAEHIYKKECKHYKTALIIYTENDLTAGAFLKILSNSTQEIAFVTVELKNFTTFQIGNYSEQNPDITFIFVNENSYFAMDDIIFSIEFYPYWYIRGKFLVIATGIRTDDDEWIRSSFESFWYRQALRVLICFWKENMKIFAYNPFTENFGFDVSNRTDIGKVFEYKITDMNGHLLKTYNFDIVMKTLNILVEKNGKQTWIGPDGIILSTFAETLNATLDVHNLSEDFSEQLVNEADFKIPATQFLRLFQDIYDFDIIFNAMKIFKDNHLDHIFLYERNDISIIVPRSTQIPEYLYILSIIPADVLWATAGSLIAISITIFLIKSYTLERTDLLEIFLDNYRYLLSESTAQNYRQYQERILTFLWLLYGIVFTTMFQSIFTSTLVVPKYYPNIDTLSDLFKTDLEIYGGAYTKYQVTQILTGENKKLVNHLIAVPTNVTIYAEDFDWIANYRHNNGFLLSKEQIYEFKYRDKNAASGAYHVMKESPMPIAYSYNLPRNKLYYKELQNYLGTIQETGLHKYWRKYNYGKNETYMFDTTSAESHTNHLNFKHLKSPFIFLLIGYSCGLVVLIGELLYYKCNVITQKNYIDYCN